MWYMKIEDFLVLQVGQVVYDSFYRIYGTVYDGEWQKVFQDHLKGSGRYICWNDGDNSKIGLELYKDQDVTHFQLDNGEDT